jgi:hypothetical protein
MVTKIASVETGTRVVFLHDPTGVVMTPDAHEAERRPSLAGGTLGLLDNAMGWTNALLDEIGQVFRERYGVAAVIKAERPNISRPTPVQMLEDLVAQSDFVVTGCGV